MVDDRALVDLPHDWEVPVYSDELGRSLESIAARGVECLTLAAAARVVAEEAQRAWEARHVRVVRGRSPSGETLASLGATPPPGPSSLVHRAGMGTVRAVPCELVVVAGDGHAEDSTDLDRDLRLYARQAGWFLASVDRLENLHRAMATRATIAQAQGLLMARYDIDAAQAFLLMRRHSQENHVRVARIAADLVADAQGETRAARGEAPSARVPGGGPVIEPGVSDDDAPPTQTVAPPRHTTVNSSRSTKP